MQRWRATPSAGSLLGILAGLLVAGAIAWLLVLLLDEPAPPLLVMGWALVALLVLALAGLAVLLWGYWSLSYTLDGAGRVLVIRWAWRTVRVPLAEIEYFGPARQVLQLAESRRLWPWPGYYLSTLRDEGLGRVRLFATTPPRRQLLVCSARGSYGISPDRPGALLEAFRRLQTPSYLPPLVPLAPADDEESGALSGAVPFGATRRATVSLFADWTTVGFLLLGGALLAAMLWFILLRYEAVPGRLPLHYTATGQPDRIGTPREIFLLPLIGALVLVANLALAWSVVRFDRFAARLLTSGSCLAQIVAWVALVKLF